MDAATQLTHRELLAVLAPLRNLSAQALGKLAECAQIIQIPTGEMLFRKGEQDNRVLYLLAGTVALNTEDRISLIKADSEQAIHPLPDDQPRSLTARTKTDVTLLQLDRDTMQRLLADNEDQEQSEEPAQDTNSWVTRFLHPTLFSSLSAANLHALLNRMEEMPAVAGQTLQQQDSEARSFCVVKQGRCSITRRLDSGEVVKLGELQPGDTFGEEVLTTDKRCNGTVVMLEEGSVVRLGERDVLELLVNPVVSFVAPEQIPAGPNAQIIDIRPEREYAQNGAQEHRNIPLVLMRQTLKHLPPNGQYVVYGDCRKEAVAAAFIMARHGFTARVLDGPAFSKGDTAPSPTVGTATDNDMERPVPTLTDIVRPPSAVTPATPTEAQKDQEEAARQQALLEATKKELEQQRQHLAEAEAARKQAEEQAARLHAEAQAAKSQAQRDAKRFAQAQSARRAAEQEIQRLRQEIEQRQQSEAQAPQNDSDAAQRRRQLVNQADQQAEQQISKLEQTLASLDEEIKRNAQPLTPDLRLPQPDEAKESNHPLAHDRLSEALTGRDESQMWTEILEGHELPEHELATPSAAEQTDSQTPLGWISDHYLWETVMGFREDPAVDELLENPSTRPAPSPQSSTDNEHAPKPAAPQPASFGERPAAPSPAPAAVAPLPKSTGTTRPAIKSAGRAKSHSSRPAPQTGKTTYKGRKQSKGILKYVLVLIGLLAMGGLHLAGPERLKPVYDWLEQTAHTPGVQQTLTSIENTLGVSLRDLTPSSQRTSTQDRPSTSPESPQP